MTDLILIIYMRQNGRPTWQDFLNIRVMAEESTVILIVVSVLYLTINFGTCIFRSRSRMFDPYLNVLKRSMLSLCKIKLIL